MEKNFILEYQPTSFYLNIPSKQYGVCINIKDIDRKEEIINYFRKTKKEQIEAWKNLWQEEEQICNN